MARIFFLFCQISQQKSCKSSSITKGLVNRRLDIFIFLHPMKEIRIDYCICIHYRKVDYTTRLQNSIAFLEKCQALKIGKMVKKMTTINFIYCI